MTSTDAGGASPIRLLRDQYGEEIVLDTGGRESQPHRIMAEFSVRGSMYAILQTEAMIKRDEVEVFRILRSPDGTLELETVADEEEWEDIAELYDEMTISFEDGE